MKKPTALGVWLRKLEHRRMTVAALRQTSAPARLTPEQIEGVLAEQKIHDIEATAEARRRGGLKAAENRAQAPAVQERLRIIGDIWGELLRVNPKLSGTGLKEQIHRRCLEHAAKLGDDGRLASLLQKTKPRNLYRLMKKTSPNA